MSCERRITHMHRHPTRVRYPIHASQAVYRCNARRSTSVTVSPRSAARTFAACHRSSGTRTVRIGMLPWPGTSADLENVVPGEQVGIVHVGPLHPDHFF